MSRLTFLVSVIIMTFTGVILASGVKSQNLKDVSLSINTKGASLKEVLTELKTKSPFTFVYTEEIGNISNIRLHKDNATLYDVLKEIANAKSLRFNQSNYLIAVVKAPQPPKPPQPGRISGKVVDDRGEPLPGASIKVLQTGQGIQTSVDGTYNLSIAPGTYTIEITYISYQTKRITEVEVKEGQLTSLNIVLNPATNALSQVTVTGSYKKESVAGMYARQKNNATVTDGITAEQIARTPDNNTAQVLARVSGLQVSDNKYVVVRGLSERYNNVLLNGASLPSSEPNRRNFAFDMVPSALLDRIVVNKTATPDLTGEFTGGLVQIETKDIPTENFFQLSVGSGYNTMSTGKEMIGLDHGKNAWVGFASDVHKKPVGMTFGEYTKIQQEVPNNASTDNPGRQQMHAFLKTMPENWTLKRYKAQPIQNYQLQAGRVIPFKNDSRLGVIAALTYRNEQDIENRSLYATYSNDFAGNNNKYATTLGASLNLGYQFGKHKLNFQNTYNRKFSDDMWKYTGIDGDNNNMRHDSYTNVTIINQLFQSQLSGEHTLSKKNIKLDWLASVGRIDRDQPYSRLVARLNGTETGEPADYLGYDLSGERVKNGALFNSELGEKVFNWAANFTVPFRLFNLAQNLKTGYQGKYRTSDFGSSLFRMKSFNTSNYPMGTPYNEVFTQQNFERDLYLDAVNAQGGTSINGAAEGYNGFQRLNAFYLMGDIKPFKSLRFIGGIRAEKNDQNIYDNVWTASGYEQKLVNNKQTDWLPSVNAIYSLTDKINFRAAWYKTVARPDFRELSSFQYWDYDYFAPVTGTKLNTTKIENFDLRLEYYPTPGEIFSVSAFYKKFKNPIEMLNVPTSSSILYQYYNLDNALDKGFEIDFRKSLKFISSTSPLFSNLYLSGNFTWIDAQVEFKEGDAVDDQGNPVFPKRDRPLAGQSPYIINGALTYAGESFGLNVAYNRYGKRLVFASTNRGMDEYENARDLLDAQISYKFLKQKRAEVKLNISNILNKEQVFYQNLFDVNNPFGEGGRRASVEPYPGGNAEAATHLDPKGTSLNKDYDTVTRRYKFGTTFSLNFSYRF